MHSNFNVLTDPLFPVITRSGARRWVTLRDLLDEQDDFPVRFNWPRGDLNIASSELAIGLSTLIFRLTGPNEWRNLWQGKSPVDIGERIRDLEPYFNLFGDAEGQGPRFCQDLEVLEDGLSEGDANGIEALFLDTPGMNGQHKNADLMTHRDRFPALGIRTVTMALYALQQFATVGGAGIYTALRGGGPMTTLVTLNRIQRDDGPVPLRRMILINLVALYEGENWLEDSEIHRALPWLRPTVQSAAMGEVHATTKTAHPVQALFGMPRRIRLIPGEVGVCPISGETERLVRAYVQRPGGTKYGIWTHPLTPYRKGADGIYFTVKPKTLGFGYRDWLGVSFGRQGEKTEDRPALVVSSLSNRGDELRRGGLSTALLVAGWATEKTTAEQFLDSTQPLYFVPDGNPDRQNWLSMLAERLVKAAEDAVSQLRGAVDLALFADKAKDRDGGVFPVVTEAFYRGTESEFHRLLRDAIDQDPGDEMELCRVWLRALRSQGLTIFDAQVRSLLLKSGDVRIGERVTKAYDQLSKALSEASSIAKALGLPQPEKPKKSKQSRAATVEDNGL